LWARNGFRRQIITNTIISGNGIYDGINAENNDTHSGNSLYNNLTIYNFANGIKLDQLPLTGDIQTYSIQNCLFHTCSENDPSQIDGYAIASLDDSINTTISVIGNAYYACDNGFHNLDPLPDLNTIQLLADPLSNPSADDFSLNDAEDGGALLKGAGASPAYGWS